MLQYKEVSEFDRIQFTIIVNIIIENIIFSYH